jgi:hypothetical protein
MPALRVMTATCAAALLLCSVAPADMEKSDAKKADMTSMADMMSDMMSEGMEDPEAGPNDWLIKHPTITRLLELHNQTRARAGLAPLTLNTDMCLAAQKHATWMADFGYFAHSGLPYRENIAYSQLTPEHAVQTWTYSPAHYTNLLSGREAGFGYQVRNGRTYWVAVFR